MQNTGINPLVIDEIRAAAKRSNLTKVILFGSRARGDYKKTSDIDLAVTGGNTALFAADMEETSTLLSFDIVDLDKPVQAELLQSIAKEGIILYEKI
ncbi:MAG: nucleotidyltransferase domain-containing protein [Phascolarctobacterium sp.]|nr:MAG: nucleotidyltransferase domain-containing protein [Phascolarctobacterium sp.]